jgi:hypothetical protein
VDKNGERQLWHVDDARCVMISCCAGAELQVRVGEDITLRELYPTKSDLYERARMLEDEHRARTASR